MKKLLLFLTLFSTTVFAEHGCYNSREISYLASELSREAGQLAQYGRGPWGSRFSDEARRLAQSSRELAQSARQGFSCHMLGRIFSGRVEPAFRDLLQEARGPRRPDVNDDLRHIRRAFQDLRREMFEDDYGRGPRPWPGRGPGRGPRF